jgi:hypothetical protein
MYNCQEDEKPMLSDFVEKQSVLVFPVDFAWTAVTGAEQWDRVCFTYREWVDEVDSVDEG